LTNLRLWVLIRMDWRLRLRSKEPVSDKTLIKQALAGDSEALEVLCDRYHSKLKKAARAYGFSDEDAEDIAQDTLQRTIEHLGTFRVEEEGAFSTWIYQITHNLMTDRWRRTKKVKFVPESQINSGSKDEGEEGLEVFVDLKSDDWVQRSDNKVALQECIERLPDEEREVIDWVFIQGKPQKELAQKHKRAEPIITKRRQKALQSLRDCLEEKTPE